MKRHLVNAAYGVLDYASYPLGMALVAPIVLHRLGAAEYGLWTIATAVVSTGSIVASGFCDANIQRVARLRGAGDSASMIRTVRSMLGINLALGSLIAALVWIAAPLAAARISGTHAELLGECLAALRIASLMVVVRTIESVFTSTQRAFEIYRDNVRVNTSVRLLTLASAALLALAGRRVVSIMAVTALFLIVGTALQFRHAYRLLGKVSLAPMFRPHETRALLGFGVFTWVQALGSVIFGHLDRLILGLSIGAAAVAPYALCVQFAHPIFGLTASGLQFLFPFLSGRAGSVSAAEFRRLLFNAFMANLALVLCGSVMLLLAGDRLIELWAGHAVALAAAPILPAIVAGSALMGLSVTGIYAVLALGKFRVFAILSLSSRAVLLLVMLWLVRTAGMQGLAASRILYGLLALLIYIPLLQKFAESKKSSNHAAPLVLACELREAAES